MLIFLPLLALAQPSPNDGGPPPGTSADRLPIKDLPVPDGPPGPTQVLAPSTCPTLPMGPNPSWPEASAAGDSAALEAYFFPSDLNRGDPERRGVRTDGLVIVHDGQIIYERYAEPYGPDTPHLAWSASKSFTNALIGIAVHQGKLTLSDSICAHLDGVPEASCAVRVQDLLEFASGFEWRETYEHDPPTTSSVLAMLYGEGQPDMAAFVAKHPLRDPPGTTWAYSSGDTNVLAAIAGRVLAPEHSEYFPWAVLLDKIGAAHTTWERDGAGTYVGSSYVWAPPRDLARFGYLLLGDGCWQGERLLPEGWVEASTSVSEPFKRKPLGHSKGEAVQGRQFWLNRAVPEIGETELPWPDVPGDAYAALGHWRQAIYVVPSRKLVVARTGDDRDGSYSHNTALSLAIALAEAR